MSRWQRMPHPSNAQAGYLFADISNNNAVAFNAHAYASAGHLLIGLKASEGTTFTDGTHGLRADTAHGARVAVLHYHFCSGFDAINEARHFWTVVKPKWKNGDRLAIDIEQPALGRLGGRAPAYLSAFDQELHKLSGQEAIGYTFRSALSSSLKVRSDKWWVAAFGNVWPAGARRHLPSGTMWAWQYTDGTIGAAGPRGAAGIGRCDMSVLSPPIVALLRKTLHR